MIAVISIGSPLKGDDNIANIILEKLEGDYLKIVGGVAPESVIGKAIDCEKVYFLDAVDFGEEPGSVRLFTTKEIEETQVSTHGFPIQQLSKLLPDSKVFVIGIQPKDTSYREDLSEELEQKKELIIQKVDSILSGSC